MERKNKQVKGGTEMNEQELKQKLELHTKWLNGEEDGVRLDLQYADLRYADLRYANLRHADLRYADLRHANLHGADLHGAILKGADLRHANLQGADIDFSCLPMWCGGLNFKIDEKQAKQLMYHVINLMQYSGIEIPKSNKTLFKWLSDSHLVTIYNLPVLGEVKRND